MTRDLTDDEQANIARLADMFAPEDLHPELQARMFNNGSFDIIQHPLVFSVPHSPISNKQLNKRFALKKEEIVEAQKAGDWRRYVFMHERPFRFNALQAVQDKFINGEDYWRVVGNVWTDSENIYQHFAAWKRLWGSDLAGRQAMMDEDELEELAAMPEILTVYRGFELKSAQRGLSWTTNRDKAVWFAKRLREPRQKSLVAQATVQKKDVLAYFNGRNENEVVVLPRSLQNLFSARV
jgi:hypothetical protein